VDITLHFDGLDPKTAGAQLHKAVREGADRAVRVACETGETVAKREAPYRTGELRDSIHGRPTGGSANQATGIVEATAAHASLMADGTNPHTIRARRKRALHWVDEGGDRFAVSVAHPGTKPDDFFEQAKAATDRDLNAAMQRVTEEAIAKLGR